MPSARLAARLPLAAGSGARRARRSSRSRLRSSIVSGSAASVWPGGRRETTGCARRGGAAHELPGEAESPELLVVEVRSQPREQLVLLLPDVVVEQLARRREQHRLLGEGVREDQTAQLRKQLILLSALRRPNPADELV